jgi:hypothetical protein
VGELTSAWPGITQTCKVCDASALLFDEVTVLQKYAVRYFRCDMCGFIQTEEPYWLVEAYSSAITKQDVGIMERNLDNLEVTSAVLNSLYPSTKKAIDFGGGHGIFVRLMRDRGFNFHWADSHASNDYARGFEHDASSSYDFLTCFEVLEHLRQPIVELEAMMSLSPNVLVSTLLLPEPVPKIRDWWYYSPLSGQHVAFYTVASLRLIAHRFGRHLLSRGPYHLFSTEPKSSLVFRWVTRVKVARILNRLRSRPSLVESDHLQMSS